ncbi:O-antigen ligase family protein [Candidatus Saccharibacteria bacterium]|nr:O-antigen ligase family protein [Candidatus Saccharibacteria bacterium]
MNKKITDRVSNVLLILLPISLFFSYHPVITIGTNSTMNLELSLPEIWLILFSLVSVPRINALFKFYRKKKLFLASIVPLYLSASIIWSQNRLRTLLTAGLLWLIVFAVLNLIFRFKMAKLEKKPPFGGIFRIVIFSLLVSAVVMSIYCWVQCVLDVAGVLRDATLLCRGCVSTAFGFPHPNGFAIEPQFMGNLLIAPVLLCYYYLCCFDKQNIFTRKSSLITVTMILSATLFLTFSRGAIYALVLGFVLEMIMLKKSKLSKTINVGIVKSLSLIVVAFMVSLVAQGMFAALGPTNDDFFSGISKSIHQLTLGKIDLRDNSQAPAEQLSTETEQTEQSFPQKQSDFSGYVAESTNRRLDLNKYAFETWKSNPQYLWIGAGLGSAGKAMNQLFPDKVGVKEIVQNEYYSLLLETGLVGSGLILLVAVITIKSLKKSKTSPLFASVIFSYLLTLMFFSGLPNALQIYLLPVLIFFV